jgi:Dolichyl-phosphate-mannose-protein mannosyltransferase
VSMTIPPTTRKKSTPISLQTLEHPEQGRQNRWQYFLHPLTAICAIQIALSLTLVWSNTAFADEAYYLWAGRLEIAHWLHGSSIPQAMLDGNLSGSPFIYPPIGALVDSIGGLAAARILSLIFMLGATILLYLTASPLLGRTAAIVASVLWASSEPAIRLAFATYDPLSVFLTALSVYLALQAGCRRHRGWLVAASAASLALANATAYSGLVIDPVVITFAFLMWLPLVQKRRALCCTAWFIGVWAIFFTLLITVSQSWTGISFTVVNRSIADYQGDIVIASDVWKYGGLLMMIAIIGAIVAIAREGLRFALLIVLLGCSTLVVPLAQIHATTAVSMDKHLAYGLWFGAMAAGYGFSRLTHTLPAVRRPYLALCCIIAFIYPAMNGWEEAWSVYHSWPNAAPFIDAFRPVAANSKGLFFVPAAQGHEDHISEYYMPQGKDWVRWDNPGLELDPSNIRPDSLSGYYAEQLHRYDYGAIVLFYETTFSFAKLPGDMILSPHGSATYDRLLGLVGTNSHEPGLSSLTLVLEQDPSYRLMAIGPYNTRVSFTNYDYGVYAIWQKKVQT